MKCRITGTYILCGQHYKNIHPMWSALQEHTSYVVSITRTYILCGQDYLSTQFSQEWVCREVVVKHSIKSNQSLYYLLFFNFVSMYVHIFYGWQYYHVLLTYLICYKYMSYFDDIIIFYLIQISSLARMLCCSDPGIFFITLMIFYLIQISSLARMLQRSWYILYYFNDILFDSDLVPGPYAMLQRSWCQ